MRDKVAVIRNSPSPPRTGQTGVRITSAAGVHH